MFIYRRYLNQGPFSSRPLFILILLLQQPTLRDLFVKEKSRKEKRSSQKGGGGHSEEEEGEGDIAAQDEMMVASSKDAEQLIR